MNATKYLSLAAIALMGTLASCQSDDDITVARPDNAVNMHLQVGSSVTTRSNAATTDADKQKQFNAGDQVSISATGQDAVIYQLQADGQTWRETETNKFLLWNASQLEFQAYYPVTTGTSMTAFTLPTDQSTEASINAADYMTKTKTIARPTTGTDISLELERQTARVIVTISGFNDQYSDADKTVSNVRINSAAAAIADGAATGSVTAVTPYANGTGTQGTTYTALLIPATANASANFITLTDALNNNLTVKGIPELEAGNSYTFNLTVGKNTIQVQSVTVQDWTTGTTLEGGQATELASSLTYPIALSAVTADYVGSVVCSDGNVYPAKTAAPAGKTAVGILGKVTATGQGLILALKDAAQQNWNTINSWTSVTTYAGTTLKVLPDDDARGTNLTSYTALGETVVSNWAVAQKSDYEAIFTNLGSDGTTYDGNVNAYITTGVGGTAISNGYWSATVADDYFAFYFFSDNWYSYLKTNSGSVRPVLGFGGNSEEQGGGLTYPIALSAVTADYVSSGSVVCSDGNVYSAKTAVPAGCTAVGILGKVTETGHGLILALEDATSQEWNTINGWTSVDTYAGTTLKVLPDDDARGTNLTSYTTLGTTAVSNWAVAQKSDYEAIFINLGSTTGDSDGTTYDFNVNDYITIFVGGTALSDFGNYWSATVGYDDYAWFFQSNNWSLSPKTNSLSVRPVLAF